MFFPAQFFAAHQDGPRRPAALTPRRPPAWTQRRASGVKVTRARWLSGHDDGPGYGGDSEGDGDRHSGADADLPTPQIPVLA